MLDTSVAQLGLVAAFESGGEGGTSKSFVCVGDGAFADRLTRADGEVAFTSFVDLASLGWFISLMSNGTMVNSEDVVGIVSTQCDQMSSTP